MLMHGSSWNWKEAKLPEDLLRRHAARFLIGVYEAALVSEPTNVAAMVALGDLYTKQGHHRKGLEVDQKLVALRPEEPTFHYNLACSHSLLGDLDRAFESLARAIDLGYEEVDHLLGDSDLQNLRSDRRWPEILSRLTEPETRC